MASDPDLLKYLPVNTTFLLGVTLMMAWKGKERLGHATVDSDNKTFFWLRYNCAVIKPSSGYKTDVDFK